MPTKQNQRLQELAALAQLYSAFQGPQVRLQEGQQQNALGILGLLAQQQHQQDVLGETRANRMGDEAYRQAMLDSQNVYHGEMAGQASNELAAKERLAQQQNELENNRLLAQQSNEAAKLGILNAHEQAKREDAQKALAATVLTHLADNPGTSITDALEIAGLPPDQYGQKAQTMRQTAYRRKADQLIPMLKGAKPEVMTPTLAGQPPEVSDLVRQAIGEQPSPSVSLPEPQNLSEAQQRVEEAKRRAWETYLQHQAIQNQKIANAAALPPIGQALRTLGVRLSSWPEAVGDAYHVARAKLLGY